MYTVFVGPLIKIKIHSFRYYSRVSVDGKIINVGPVFEILADAFTR